MNELALFAGAGGGILGGKLLGWRTVCAVEWEQYPASVLCARQNDGLLPPFPIWDDVQSFRGEPWRGIVDVVSGGFPCTDISAAGKGAGIDGETSGMWREMARIIHEVRPRFVFVENSPMLTSRGLGRVLGDLASMGFDAKWGVLGAADVGANHQRNRIWIVAKWSGQLSHAQHDRIRWWEQQQTSIAKEDGEVGKVGDTSGVRRQVDSRSISTKNENSQQNCRGRGTFNASENECSWTLANPLFNGLQGIGEDGGTEGSAGLRSREGSNKIQDLFGNTKEWWAIEPDVGRVANGVAARVDRLKAIGNGQVPLCAATAWRILSEG